MPPNKQLRQTRKAMTDIAAIWSYTMETWSGAQADAYVDDLDHKFDLILLNPRIGVLRQEVNPPVRLHRHRSHIIVYREIGDDIRIERVLHTSQNWQAILGG